MNQLTPESLAGLRAVVLAPFRFERVRLVPEDVTAIDIAKPRSYRWHNHNNFTQDGLLFEVWINWDGRVRIECEGEIILRMWCPAGEIFEGMDRREKASLSRNVTLEPR